ncbi:MAG: hypothetical protein ACYDBB_01425 [Armatimonadota bacterium]
MELLKFAFTHGDAFITLLLSIIGVVKLTAWGRANAEALALLVDVVEQKNSTEIKQAVATQQTGLSEVAQDALADAVNTADAKKTPLTTALRICREVLRGLFAVRG